MNRLVVSALFVFMCVSGTDAFQAHGAGTAGSSRTGVSPAVAEAVPGGRAARSSAADDWCDRNPAEGDFVLPLPACMLENGGTRKMCLVLRRVDVDAPLRKPVEMRIGIDGKSSARLYGMFERGDLPKTWRKGLPGAGSKRSVYFIGKYEVTNAQWHAVMGTLLPENMVPDRPKRKISCREVDEFLERCNTWLKRTPETSGMGAGAVLPEDLGKFLRRSDVLLRLPTEAEWEFAAGGGLQGAAYSAEFGSDPSNHACFSGKRTLEAPNRVGMKRPNPLGIYDMYGNAWEIVNGEGVRGLPGGPVKKGGSYMSSEIKPGARFTMRLLGVNGSAVREEDTGFRVVLACDLAQMLQEDPVDAVPGPAPAAPKTLPERQASPAHGKPEVPVPEPAVQAASPAGVREAPEHVRPAPAAPEVSPEHQRLRERQKECKAGNDWPAYVELLKKEAEQFRDAGAANKLGNMYWAGKFVDKHEGLARAWFMKGAEWGSAEAMDALGDMYRGGNGVVRSQQKALEWYEKARRTALEHGDHVLAQKIGMKKALVEDY